MYFFFISNIKTLFDGVMSEKHFNFALLFVTERHSPKLWQTLVDHSEKRGFRSQKAAEEPQCGPLILTTRY